MDNISTYTTKVEPAQSISFGPPTKIWKGFAGILCDADGKEVDRGKHRFGTRAKSTAKLDAENLRRRYVHHLRTTGRRLEVERREQAQALREARDASLARRQALTNDRRRLWHALEEARRMLGDQCPSDLADLVERHRQAVIDIEADPRNERGGLPVK